MKTFDLSLYLVLDPDLCAGFGMVATAREAVAGGVTMVQLRDKRASTAGLIETGLALKSALSGSGARLVINDDVEAAIAIGADGLHIGQDDAGPGAARARIGPDMILGVSVETAALAARSIRRSWIMWASGRSLPRRPSLTTSSRSDWMGWPLWLRQRLSRRSP